VDGVTTDRYKHAHIATFLVQGVPSERWSLVTLFSQSLPRGWDYLIAVCDNHNDTHTHKHIYIALYIYIVALHV